MAQDFNSRTTQSLYNFMTQLNKNTVRTQNLFEMRIFLPMDWKANPVYKAGGKDLTKFLNPRFTFYGTCFELPSRTMQYENVGFKGFTVPVPTVLRMTQEHSVTINSYINGDMRRAFLMMQALTMNGQINEDGGYFEGNRLLKNSAKIYISLLDPTYKEKHQVMETYTLYGVTVAEVGTMNFSNTEAGLATFTVQFKSQYWQYGMDSDAILKTKRKPVDGSDPMEYLDVDGNQD